MEEQHFTPSETEGLPSMRGVRTSIRCRVMVSHQTVGKETRRMLHKTIEENSEHIMVRQGAE